MKKQTVSILIILLSISSLFFSCGNNVNKNVGGLEFDSLKVNETAHLFGDTAKPACSLSLTIEYATKASEVRFKDSVNALFLTACLGQTYAAQQPKKAIRNYADKYISDYRKDLEPMYQKDEEEKEDSATMKAWYAYYKNIAGHVQLYTKNLLVYRIDYSEYTGGAHGMYTSTFLNLDLQTLKPVQLGDLFAGDYKEALTDLLWNQLMSDNKVSSHQELEDMGYATTGDLEPTENFYIGEDGITFYYNVYDITPYVMGATKITLPYDIMQHILNKESIVSAVTDR